MDELAILNDVKENQAITQKALVEKIGKSERTIKTKTVEMQKKVLFKEQTANATVIGKY